MEQKEIEEIVICRCYSPEHQLIFRTIDGDSDVYVTFHLTRLPFFKRIVHAVKYIFGYTSKYGDFDELIISPKELYKFKVVVKYLEEQTKE